MSKTITNDYNLSIAMLVWLGQTDYDSGADVAPNGQLISVTTLMKPTRALILSRQVNQDEETYDASDMIASRMGQSIHTGVEESWTKGDPIGTLKRFGYPAKVTDNIKINPDPATLQPTDIPVYLEQRGFLEIGGIVLTGKLDFSFDGEYTDFKSTSVFSYMSGNKDEDYALQGSLYKLIMPKYIQKDIMNIDFIFTDYQSFMAKQNPNYPQTKAISKQFPLMDTQEAEQWVLDKIQHIKDNASLPQDQMVRCTPKELWMSDPTFKYYAKEENYIKGGKSSKNFDSYADAMLYRDSKGTGIVITVPGEVKACPYCPAAPICEQRKEYFHD